MKVKAKLAGAGAATALVIGGLGVGLAYADPSSPAPSSPSASPTSGAPRQADQPRRGGKPRLLARALHGEVTMAGPKHRVVVFQKGTVTAVADDSITVTSADGFRASYAVTGDTKVRVAKGDAAIDDVQTDTRVRVVASKDGDRSTARRIVVPQR